MALARALVVVGGDLRPLAVLGRPGEGRFPGTIGTSLDGSQDLLAVDGHGGRGELGLHGITGREVEGETSDVRSLYFDRALVDQLGVDLGLLPVFDHAVDPDPMHAVIAEEVGGEGDFLRRTDAAFGSDGGEASLDLDHGVRVDLMGGLRPDDVGEFHAELTHLAGHHVGGLLLLVELAAVGDRRSIAEVDGGVGGVIPSPESLLPGRDPGDVFVLEDVQKLRGLGEAGAGIDTAPAIGVVGTELPDSRATHGKAADEQAVVVDVVALTGVRVGLPEVDLAGHLVGAAVTAVKMEYQTVVGRELADVLPAIAEEREFAQGLTTAMAPEVEAHE